jgi:ankyrin repeat protein
MLRRTGQIRNKETVKMLLAAGADVDFKIINEETPLHIAAEVGKLEIVKLLLAPGTNVNAQMIERYQINGWRALHIAAANSHVRVSPDTINRWG